MRSFRLAVLLCAFACCVSCSQILVTHDYDSEVDYSLFTSYVWHPVERTIAMNDLVINRVKDAVNRELKVRGYEQVLQGADFSIAIHFLERQRVSFTDRGHAAEPYWGGYGYRYGSWYGHSRVSARDYREGTLIIDILGTAKKELVWRGTATDIIEPRLSPEERTAAIHKAVSRILQKFPPFP